MEWTLTQWGKKKKISSRYVRVCGNRTSPLCDEEPPGQTGRQTDRRRSLHWPSLCLRLSGGACRDLLQAATGQVHGQAGAARPQPTWSAWFFVTKFYLSSLIRQFGCVQTRSTWPRWCWISSDSSNSVVVLLFVLAEFLVRSEILFGLEETSQRPNVFEFCQGDVTVFVPQPWRREGLVSLRTSSVYFEGTELFTAHVDDKSKDKHGAVAGTSVR